MLNIAVCDDNIKDLNAVSDMIKDICAEIRQECCVSSYQHADDMFDSGIMFDIGIIDVGVPENDGIDIGRKLIDRFPEISLIYVSVYEEYCRQVINTVHAFSYLIKPVEKDELKSQLLQCVIKAAKRRDKNILVFDNARSIEGELFPIIRINTDDILYCEYVKMQREVLIVLKDETYFVRKVFDDLSDILKPFGFELNRRGSIVNLRHIKRVRNYVILLDDGKELVLSQKRAPDFRIELNRFMHKSDMC